MLEAGLTTCVPGVVQDSGVLRQTWNTRVHASGENGNQKAGKDTSGGEVNSYESEVSSRREQGFRAVKNEGTD